jgi:flagellar motor switch protein FliM
MIEHTLPRAAGRAASHCAALLARRETQADLGLAFEQFGARLTQALHGCVAAVADDPQVRIASLGATELAGDELRTHCAPLVAASRHLFGGAEHALLLALDGRAILEQLDRTFGGPGEIEGCLPAQLPNTAAVLAQRLERQVLAAIAGELGGLDFRAAGGTPAEPFSALDPAAPLTVLSIAIEAARGREWRIVIALETAALSSLLPKRASAPRAVGSRHKPAIDEAPFADLPLCARARLVDMDMPLHRVAAIAPGAVLPIVVARSVPLQVGETLIACGTVGEIDDQIALQITQTFTKRDNQ